MIKDDIYGELGTLASGYSTYCDEPFKNIFKKSEHDEIMDELAEIKRKLDRLQPSSWIPYPYPYIPYIPYPYDDYYPKPYYYGYGLQWTYTTSGCTS